jgi:hypothetical protein
MDGWIIFIGHFTLGDQSWNQVDIHEVYSTSLQCVL